MLDYRRILAYGWVIYWLDSVPRLRPIRFWTRVFKYALRKQEEAYDRRYPLA
jgi:hypothetical protein